MEIIWTDRALYSYDKNIAYLLDEWTMEVALKFIKKVEEGEKCLIINPNLGRFDEELKLNKLLIVEQIFLFYEIDDGYIVLIDFWNNFQKPYWL